MVQTHIIRSDLDPLTASKTGQDISICGTCTHRGTPTTDPKRKTAERRTCYVNLGQGPLIVYKGLKRGIYPTATPAEIRAIGRARMVRLGTYGDPAAVPRQVWQHLLQESEGHTGYTHQHHTAPDYDRLMYSADSKQEAATAHAKGYRTFRVIPVKEYQQQGPDALLHNEILCPASKEQGNRATCNTCKLCTGSTTKARSIAIVAHGTGRNNIRQTTTLPPPPAAVTIPPDLIRSGYGKQSKGAV